MLLFNMETRRIADLIKIGAQSRLTDLQFLTKEVNTWLTSRERKMQIAGDLYYGYEQDIKKKQRLVIGEDGKMVPDPMLPNNKLLDNQYARAVDQKVNYMLSKPITFTPRLANSTAIGIPT